MPQDPNWGIEHVPDNVSSGHTVANTAFDEIIQGVSDPFAIDLTSGNYTFSTDDDYVLNFTFQMSGHTVARDVTFNAAIKKFAVFDNQGTGVVTLNMGTADVLVEPGEIATVYSDGVTNSLIKVGSSFALDTSLSGVVTETGTTHTPSLAQANKHIRYTNAAAITVTIPPNSTHAFPISTVLNLEQSGAGTVSVAAGGGVTINTPSAFSQDTAEQYAIVSLIKTATDTWTLFGYLAAA